MRAIRLFRVAFVALLALAGVIALPAQAQKPLIAVLPFQAIEVSASTAQIIATLFETNLVNTDAYTVLSQNERQQILSAQEESLAECTDEACAVQIGKLLAAEQIIMGTVAALGRKLIINAKIIDVQTSKTLAAGNQSADSVEELDLACDRLTTALVAKVMPRAAAAVAAKPAAEPAKTTPAPAATETKPAAEPAKTAPAPAPVETKPQPEPKPARVPRVRPEPSPTGIGIAAIALTSTGNALTQAGWYARSMSFTAERQAELAWRDYFLADENLGGLYYEYETAHRRYLTSSAVAYSLWTAGPAAFATPVFLFPNRPLALSVPGQIVLATSMALSVGGNLAHAVSTTRAQIMDAAWVRYSQASENLTDLYGAYQDSYGQYRLATITSYTLWALSAAAVPAAFFMPGARSDVATSLASKLMVAAGSLALSAGGYTFGAAQTKRTLADAAWRRYINAGENLTELYSQYESLHKAYVATTVSSAALWATGGAAVAAALFIPDGGRARADVTVGLGAAEGGLTVAVAGRL